MRETRWYQHWRPYRVGTTKTSDGYSIHYKLYHSQQIPNKGIKDDEEDVVRIVMIAGIATDWDGWKFQVEDFLMKRHEIGKGVVCCVMDNRGVGRSSSPSRQSEYSTSRMAMDVVETMDSLSWATFHCLGFSMGGMVACKVATLAPQKLISLSILSRPQNSVFLTLWYEGCTNGGFQIIPRTLRGLKYLLLSCFSCTHWLRSHCDLRFHYTTKTLQQRLDSNGTTREQLLMMEYMSNSMKCTQTANGLSGQLRACWTHGLTDKECEIIKSGRFPVLVIHGQHDILAAPKFGKDLADRLNGIYIEVDGAHMIKRECRNEVSRHLINLIKTNTF